MFHVSVWIMFKMWMSVDSLTVQFAQQEVVLIVRRIRRKWIFVTKLWIIWRLLLRIWRRWRLGWSRQWHLDISITFDLNLLLPILFNVHSVDLLGQGKTKFVTITRICKNNVSSIYNLTFNWKQPVHSVSAWLLFLPLLLLESMAMFRLSEDILDKDEVSMLSLGPIVH